MASRLLVIVEGTLGDALPLFAIGAGLLDRGHEVRVLCNDALQPMADRLRLATAPLGGNDPQAVQEEIRGQERQSYLGNAIARVRQIVTTPYLPSFDFVDRVREHVAWCGVAVVSYMFPYVVHVAEQQGRPAVIVHPTPTLPTGNLAYPVGPLWWHMLPKPRIVNAMTHRAWTALVERGGVEWTRRLRTEHLGLPERPAASPGVPRIVAASTTLFERPRDWPPVWHLTGYVPPLAVGAPELPAEVQSFLASGPSPVLVGFGSSPIPEGWWERVLLPAVRQAGQRAIVVSGWARVPATLASRDVLVVPFVSYEAMFPRVACVVHACGIGTLTEAVRSGTPSVAVPGFGEQKLIAAHAYRLGLVPRPVLLRHVTAPVLAARITEALTTASLHARTRAFATRIRQEQGASAACDVVEGLMPASARRGPPVIA